MRGTRALLALVIVMTVLLVIGTTALVVVIVHRLTHPGMVAEAVRTALPPRMAMAMATATATATATALAQEPPGTRITALTRQSDTWLAIALSGGGPDRVLVWDLPSGRPVTEIRLGR